MTLPAFKEGLCQPDKRGQGTRYRWRNPDRERHDLDDEPLIPMIRLLRRFLAISAAISYNTSKAEITPILVVFSGRPPCSMK